MSGPRIVFCSNNHIYDASLYDRCPYCSKIGEEQKELVTPAAAENPYAGGFAGTDGSVSKDLFSEDPFSGTDTGFLRETADFFGPESADEDPYGATAAGTGQAAAAGKYEFGDPFGAAVPGSMPSGNETLKSSYVPSEAEKPEAEVPFVKEDSGAEMPFEAVVKEDPEAEVPFVKEDSGAEMPFEAVVKEDPEAEVPFEAESLEVKGPEAEVPFETEGLEAEGPGIEVPFETEGLEAEVSFETEGLEAKASEAEMPFETEGHEALEKVFQSDSESGTTTGEADVYSSKEEDEWDSFPLKNEGPVRGWFVLQNGVQKDHSV